MTKRKPAAKPARLMIVNLARTGIGEPLNWQDFKDSLKERGGDAGVRAVWNLCMYQLNEARKHEEDPAMPTDERHYASGRAFAAGQIIQGIYLLIAGSAEDFPEKIKELFGWEPQEERKVRAMK